MRIALCVDVVIRSATTNYCSETEMMDGWMDGRAVCLEVGGRVQTDVSEQAALGSCKTISRAFLKRLSGAGTIL